MNNFKVGAKGIFHTPYEQYKEKDGFPFEIVKVFDKDDNTHDISEVGIMYLIKFSNGEQIEAWPEELIINEGIDFNKYKKYLMGLPIEKIVDSLNDLFNYEKHYVYSDEKLRELLNIKPTDSLLYVYKKFKKLFDKDLIDTDGEVITCVSSIFTIDNRDYVCKKIISVLTNEFEERNEDFEKWFNDLNLGIDSPLNDCFKK